MGNNTGKPHKKVSYKLIAKELTSSRKENINNVKNQDFSFTKEYPAFSRARGGFSKLDLCVLANKPSRDCMLLYFILHFIVKVLKKTCQDEAAVIRVNDNTFIAGVFDGHGPKGERMSKMCVSILQKRYSDELALQQLIEDPKKSLNSLIEEIHSIAISNKDLKPKYSGSTATVALLHEDELHISWVGDSKAILLTTYHDKFLQMDSFDLTKEHDFSTTEEVSRIKNSGGVVTRDIVDDNENKGVLRVWSIKEPNGPGLAMSKSIGDLAAHMVGCSAEADYVNLNIKKIDEEYKPNFKLKQQSTKENTQKTINTEQNKVEEVREVKHCVAIIASDGVWNAMSNDEVAKFVSLQLYERCKRANEITQEDSINISTKLCLEAQKRWLKLIGSIPATTDDISAITMVLY